jgi:hypothetical protein
MIQTATQEMPHFSLASRQTFCRVYQEKFTASGGGPEEGRRRESCAQ